MLKHKEEYIQKNKQHSDPKVAAIEKKSGLSLQDVHIHYDSSKPHQFHAHAYTYGSDVYLAKGQTQYLNHELAHVVQQKMGIVKPMAKYKGLDINQDPNLEKQADSRIFPFKMENRNHNFVKPVLQRKEIEALKQDVKTGSEFTFAVSDIPSLSDLSRPESFQEGEPLTNLIKGIMENIKRILDGKIQGSMEVYEGKDINITDGGKFYFSVFETKVAFNDEKKYKNLDYKTVEVTLQYQRIDSLGAGEDESLEIRFDIDPGCIETQVSPISYNVYLSLKEMFESLIFDTMKTIGSQADPSPITGGGGHISLHSDILGTDKPVETLKRIIEKHDERIDGYILSKDYTNDDPDQYIDNVNAPLISRNERKQREYREINREIIGNSINAFITNIIQRVYSIRDVEQQKDIIKDDELSHYQAINLDHVMDQERIEFRRFNAQESIDDYLADLDFLLQLVSEAQEV